MAAVEHRHRSHLYHEGYEETQVKDGFGFKTIFVYVANYYKPRLTESFYPIHKVLMIAFTLIAFALQVIAGTQKSLLNVLFFVNIFQMINILSSIVSLIGVIYYAFTPQIMKIHYYKRLHCQFPWAYLISWISALGIIVTSIIGIVLLRQGLLPEYIAHLIMYLISGILMFVVWQREFSMQYECICSENIQQQTPATQETNIQ